MKIVETSLPGVLIIEPKVFGDPRGYFVETWQQQRYAEAGIHLPFVQDNLSRSARGILRGLHLQHPGDQGKLVFVVEGEVFDVAVDVRVGSPTFGKWAATTLSAADHRQFWVPPGFAHGFCVTSEYAEFLYLTTDYWAPEYERCIAWNDPDLAIAWPLSADPMVSAKDQQGTRLKDADLFP